MASLAAEPSPQAPNGQSRTSEDAAATPNPADEALAARRLDFLAKVSHEVRTPLNSILGFTELMMQERFGPIGNPRYKGYVEDIHQSGLYALSLLNDLLDISKIEAGKFELDFTAVELAELVEDCVNSLQPLAKRERILLRTSFASSLPAVIADPRRLKQILLNLLSNAIKFTAAGGQVIVSGSMIEGGELRLRVRDNGVGMTKDEIALAMQPFHQLDTAPIPGTRLTPHPTAVLQTAGRVGQPAAGLHHHLGNHGHPKSSVRLLGKHREDLVLRELQPVSLEVMIQSSFQQPARAKILTPDFLLLGIQPLRLRRVCVHGIDPTGF